MTIFIASLFLPYTADFNKEEEELQAYPLPSQSTIQPQEPVSILAPPPPPPPKSAATPVTGIPPTPGATTDLEKIFVPEDVNRPLKLRLPSSNSVTRLSTLVRAETHSPGWGKNITWKQPPSTADEPPVASLVSDVQHVRRASGGGPAAIAIRPRHQQRQRSRPTNQEQQSFTEENLSIIQSNVSNGGLISAIEAAQTEGLLKDKHWIGTLGMPTDALDEKVKKRIEERLELDFESLLILTKDNDLNGHYEHYCKTILWPHLHYQIPDQPKSKAYEDHSWGFYVKVNQAFADRIVKNWKRGDIIWVHDYHLLLVPGMVRKKLPDAEIGFFLHTAFPSSEIFRCIPTRHDLLEGMLGANMIGFQAHEYIHHFLQTCSRLMNVETTQHGIILDDGRFVHANTFPMGIDIPTLEQHRQNPDVEQWINIITQKYQGKRLLVARDKLDSVRGVRQKLLAYEGLLKRYPEYADKTVLIQIATSATEEQELSNFVGDIVTRLNSSYSSLAHQPVVFLKQDIDYSQWLALLHVAEALVVTSLREGMNLSGHEYIQCQDGKFGTNKHGPLIMSEFTGAASILKQSALLVNPWDYKQCTEAMRQALEMSSQEKEQRWNKMRKVIAKHNATEWFSDYCKALDRAYKEHSIRDATAVPRLSINSLKKSYIQSSNRLIILDYEGTLANWGLPTETELHKTPQQTIDVLNSLLEDSSNTVYVMSARPWQELDSMFERVPGIGLIGENGAFLRRAGESDWSCACDLEHVESWKDGVNSILDYYSQRIAGSRVEEVNTALIFKYDSAEDKEGAFKQAGECANHINDVCARQGVHAVPIDHGICIADSTVNKGYAAGLISDKFFKDHEDTGEPIPDFILVIGDSREDEYVFDWATKMKNAGISEVTTVTVGQRNTAASATVTQGVSGVISALRKLTTNDMLPSPLNGTSSNTSPSIKASDV